MQAEGCFATPRALSADLLRPRRAVCCRSGVIASPFSTRPPPSGHQFIHPVAGMAFGPADRLEPDSGSGVRPTDQRRPMLP
jgi:hypothetical protein